MKKTFHKEFAKIDVKKVAVKMACSKPVLPAENFNKSIKKFGALPFVTLPIEFR